MKLVQLKATRLTIASEIVSITIWKPIGGKTFRLNFRPSDDLHIVRRTVVDKRFMLWSASTTVTVAMLNRTRTEYHGAYTFDEVEKEKLSTVGTTI